MKEYSCNSEFIKTAVILSRMYGVAETLNPFSHIADDDFTNMIYKWTDEYLKSGGNDILTFFQEKISLCEKETIFT